MKTLKIGSQEWATEDLKVTKFRNGEDIPLVTDDDEWSELTTAAYCISPKGSYLYNWYAVNDPRGLAPEGFHVPSDEEWTDLENFLGGASVAGAKMKSSPSDSPAWDGTNSSGFSALPGGFRISYFGFFDYGGYYCSWWSSSASGTELAWYRYLNSDDDDVVRYYNNLRSGFSVRCLKTLTE
jgi:uncharacterized protein (TIGR02145 family)